MILRLICASALLLTLVHNTRAGMTTLHSFDMADGQLPQCTLVMDAQGNIYGTTTQGGAPINNDDGTIFKIAAGTGTFSTLTQFNGPNGAGPITGLTIGNTGTIYGTTNSGGSTGYGTLFTVNPTSGAITTLATFDGVTIGSPTGKVVQDSQGNLYGASYYSNNSNYSGNGMVYKYNATSKQLSVLASFNGTNGANPIGPLTMDSAGNIYGTTYNGGAHSDGSIFEIKAGTTSITILASFNNTNGFQPSGGVIMDKQGNLYGTTTGGGANSNGVVFELSGGNITDLVTFNSTTTGANPSGELIMDSQGNIYGMTGEGGAVSSGTAWGTIFTINGQTHALTPLAVFDSTNGSTAPLDGGGPVAGLLLDNSGDLYGTTPYGGAYVPDDPIGLGYGTVFALPGAAPGSSVPEPGTMILGMLMLCPLLLKLLHRYRTSPTPEPFLP